MRTWIATVLLGAFLAAVPSPGPALAQELGNAADGQRFSREVCAACHAVEKGDKMISLDGAPPFQDIADDPAASEVGLRVFLRSPHEGMPDLILSDEESDDVVAYILSLR
ncbi:MAG: cytochrome c [Rhodospirillales bacterium]|nr:cytochrome c [Rhodospirillales bacterium]